MAAKRHVCSCHPLCDVSRPGRPRQSAGALWVRARKLETTQCSEVTEVVAGGFSGVGPKWGDIIEPFGSYIPVAPALAVCPGRGRLAGWVHDGLVELALADYDPFRDSSLPHRCGVVTRSEFEAYFGPFASRLFLLSTFK